MKAIVLAIVASFAAFCGLLSHASASPGTVVAVSSELPPDQTAAIVEMANAAAIAWGHSYPMRLRVVAGNPADYAEGVVAFAGPAFEPGQPLKPHGKEWDCLLGVMPTFWGENVVRQSLINHEFGHCLGFDHPAVDEPSIMASPSYGITALDIARYRALWPDVRPYAVTLPALAHD